MKEHPGDARIHLPEQVARRPITVQTDVFNLGATLYWTLVGKTIPTLYTVNKKGDNSFLAVDMIDTPAKLNPKVPASLSNLVMESISTNPEELPGGHGPGDHPPGAGQAHPDEGGRAQAESD